METFLNENNKPIIRRCANCVKFDKITPDGSLGYCTIQKLLFAFTHTETVSIIVKPHYLCLKHELKNEQELITKGATKVDLKSCLKAKDKI